MRLLVDKQQQANLWDVREAGLGATAFVPGEKDTWPGWEDSAVAPEQVGGYLRDLRKLYDNTATIPRSTAISDRAAFIVESISISTPSRA